MNARKTLLEAILLASITVPPMAVARDYSPQYDHGGAVFTQTNAANGNAVLMFTRSSQGQLKFVKAFATRGQGSGDGLGNQGALSVSNHHNLLFVVNAGSNEISAFKITNNGLKLVDKISSGGNRPVSLTVHKHLLYVVNAGSDNITGFTFDMHGHLSPLRHSTRTLSGIGTGAAEIAFNPWGDVLAVTEKATNMIDTWNVDPHGLPGDTVVNPSAGATPFGFLFDRRGNLIVSEAAGGAADASSTSSYRIRADGSLEIASAAVPTTETAACWVMTTPNGRYAYVTNAGSASVSGYEIQPDGSLSLLDTDGVTASTGEGSHPVDMAISKNGRFLYVSSTASQEIIAYRVNADGALEFVQQLKNLPAGFNGLAGF